MFKIAIDGPSGAGKSSVSKSIAKKMGIVYVDTGAMYRTIGLFVRQNDTDPHDEAAVSALLDKISLDIRYIDGEQHIFLCGEDVGDSIRTPEMSMYASAVSALPTVRAFLLDTQRNLAKTSSVIMDGRDIGTVIFPDAEVKIFLTASNEARAKRRYDELCAKGIETSYEDVLADIIKRDKNDSERAVAPAVAAKDAILVDTSDMSFEESVSHCVKIIEKALKKKRKAEKKSGLYMTLHFLLARFFRTTMRIHIHGIENVPARGGAVVCSNHLSLWDVTVIGATFPRQVRFLAKAELKKIPIVAQFLKAMGACFVNRRGSDVEAIKSCVKMSKSDELVGIFPQGTRRTGLNPADTPVKNGAGMIAFRAEVPMIPVCIVAKGMKYRFLRRRDIYIGEPMYADELGFKDGGNAEYMQATERVFLAACRLGGFEKSPALTAPKSEDKE